MTAALVPVDIEGAVIVLLDAGTTASVASKVPNPRPTGGYVRVTRAGGTNLNLIQSRPRVLVECWHDDETTALQLAQRCWALLWAAQDSFMTPEVYVTEIESTEPVNFEDPATDSARYQFISSITTSLAEVTL